MLPHAPKRKMSRLTKLNDFSGKSCEFVGQWLDYSVPGVGNQILEYRPVGSMHINVLQHSVMSYNIA